MIGFNFWNKWMLTASFLIILGGLSLILFNQSPLFTMMFNEKVNPIFWGTVAVANETVLFQQWVYSTMGAILVGWGIFMTFICTHAFRNKEPWAWNCFALGLVLWFIADTAVSSYFHVVVNVITNTIVFVAFALPLIFTRRYFI